MTDLLSFLGLCLLITITPGLDTAVVIRSVVNGGRNAGLQTAAGCAAGLFVHAVAVALGLAEVLVRSATAFELVKFCGAMLLVILGGRSLWAAWKARGAAADVEAVGEARRSRGSTPFLQGLFSNLGNPKAALFFLASLPQFIPDDRPGAAVPVALMLAGIAVVFQLTGLGLTAVAANRLRRVLKSPRMRRAQDAALGATLVALGVRVALE
ncbi:LysE family translocator [Streptomyces sp. NPDC052701]|uniref:LysE family translocator n=1 Tax=Streptomyces sp. NPDC052701 TaxID=3155533 RepID=UPI00343F7A0F